MGPVSTRSPASAADGMQTELVIDRIACDGFGLCAELLPELLELDDWGYPIVKSAAVPDALLDHAKRAVVLCPVLALKLARRSTAPVERGQAGWHGTPTRTVRP